MSHKRRRQRPDIDGGGADRADANDDDVWGRPRTPPPRADHSAATLSALPALSEWPPDAPSLYAASELALCGRRIRVTARETTPEHNMYPHIVAAIAAVGMQGIWDAPAALAAFEQNCTVMHGVIHFVDASGRVAPDVDLARLRACAATTAPHPMHSTTRQAIPPSTAYLLRALSVFTAPLPDGVRMHAIELDTGALYEKSE